MSFNVNELPNERRIVSEGLYLATIKNTRIRIASTGNRTLNMQLQTEEGQLWDQITESENENALYKVKRLLVAADIVNDLPPECELEDIAPLLLNKKIGIRVVHQPDLQNNDRAVVAFRDPIYMSEAEFPAYQEADAQNAILVAGLDV